MKTNISIEWWSCDHDEDTIPEEHKNELEENALVHISKMRKEGFVCGQLLASIYEFQYQGWWEVKNETKTNKA